MSKTAKIDDWTQIKPLVMEALDRPPTERQALLDLICGRDGAVRARVEQFVRAYERGERLLEPSATGLITDPLIGQRIARYTIEQLLGYGGMGAVYRARQDQPSRIVALKLMRGGLVSREAQRRFEFESQILGRLHHPGIAQVYEAGVHEAAGKIGSTGTLPFFAMEYVENGIPITAYVERNKLATRQRLELMAQVCDAVHYGHQQGVIHRDLKPANILVDAAGRPKIIDFGVARATDAEGLSTTLSSGIGQLIGTLQYMSPEQFETTPAEGLGSVSVDARADIYALGVVFYEVLAVSAPYDLSGVTVAEAARKIRDDKPAPLGSISKVLRGDIETIVFTAMERDKTRRYQSADGLAADIRHYLNNEPISAHPPSAAYQLRVFARRNKGLVAGVAAAFGILILGIVGTSIGLARAEQKSREAEFEAYVANIAAADAALRSNEIATVRRRLEACAPSLRNWEWRYLAAQADTSLLVFRKHTDGVSWTEFSPDGLRVVTASADQTARIWDAHSGQELAVLRGHEGGVNAAFFSPNGMRVLTHGQDCKARIWDAETGNEIAVLRGHESRITWAAFSSNATRVATCAWDQTVRVWDSANGTQLALFPLESLINTVTFSPDGQRLIVGTEAMPMPVLDASTGEQVATLVGHRGGVTDTHLSSDGSRIVTASLDKTARIWNAESYQEIAVLTGHTEFVKLSRFSPDGRQVLTASYDGTARIWDAADGHQIAVLGAAGEKVSSASFRPDSASVVTISSHEVARTWDAKSGKELGLLRGHDGILTSVRYSSDGQQILTASSDGTARLWDADFGGNDLILPHEEEVGSAAFGPDGERVLTGAADMTAHVWDVVSGEAISALRSELPETEVRIAPFFNVFPSYNRDGSRIVTCFADHTARLWDGNTERELTVLRGHNEYVSDAAFSPDGSRIWTTSRDRTVRMWDSEGGHQIDTLPLDARELAISPDGSRMVTIALDNDARVWSIVDAVESVVLHGHEGMIKSVAWSNDGSQILTVSSDKTARVWDATSGKEIAVLGGHRDSLTDGAFSPDGSRILTCSEDRTVRLWDTQRWREIAVLRGHESGVNAVAFSPDGSRIVTGSHDWTARIWNTEPYAIRYPSIVESRSAHTTMKALIESRLREGDELESIAAGILIDDSLSDRARLTGKAIVVQERRKRLLAEAQARAESTRLNMSAWRVVSHAGYTTAVYETALQEARKAGRLSPDDGNILNTLGVALYRNGLYEEAVQVLERSSTLSLASRNIEQPADIAFLAMCHFKLGHFESATSQLDQLRVLMQGPRNAGNEESQRFLQEAQTTLAN